MIAELVVLMRVDKCFSGETPLRAFPAEYNSALLMFSDDS